MGSHHQLLLPDTKEGSLGGRRLTHLMEQRAEVAAFLMKHNYQLAKALNEENMACKLTYLAVMFSKLNKINLQLEIKTATFSDAKGKTRFFNEGILCIG